jgi:hypothetical protein
MAESTDQVPESPQTTPRVVQFSSKRISPEEFYDLTRKVDDLEIKIEDIKNENSRQKVSTGGNMSDTPSKDWVERKISEVDNKIEMDRVKSDARFEKLISDSDIKFEKLIGEMNAKFAINESKIIQVENTHIKWMSVLVFSFIAFTLAAIGFSTNLILKAIPSPSAAQQVQNSPPSTVTEIPKK